jgi:ribosomal protein S4
LDKPKKFRRNKTTMRSRYRLLAKKVKLFYNLRSTQKSLRKLLVHRKFKRANPTYNTASFLETRLDVFCIV